MDSDLEIKKFLAQQLKDGATLSEAQNRINEQFKRSLTFMDIRVLASSLDEIDWSARDPAPKAPEAPAPEAPAPLPGAGDGKTHIEMSKVLRPGALAGGSVRFASGASAEWVVDQYGRLALDKPVGKPTEEDLRSFQTELEALFSRQ